MKLPDKSSAADPLPVPLLKQVVTDIAPFLTELFNRSLAAGRFPSAFKEAFVTPVIKKPNLDAAEVSSYRPIKLVSDIEALIERLDRRQATHRLPAVYRPSAASPVWVQARPLHRNRCPAGAFRHSWGCRQW